MILQDGRDMKSGICVLVKGWLSDILLVMRLKIYYCYNGGNNQSRKI